MNGPTALVSTQMLIGAQIVNSRGKELGYLEDLMISVESGAVVYAVFFLGNGLGVGRKHFAIPWQALLVESDSESILLTIKKESLNSVIMGDKNGWPPRLLRFDDNESET